MALKEIEKATLKIVQAMEKNRTSYAEASAWYKDTGYDRYFKKMDKLEKEYEEYKKFLHITDEPNFSEESAMYKELDNLKRAISTIKSKVYYLSQDLPQCTELITLKEFLKDY